MMKPGSTPDAAFLESLIQGIHEVSGCRVMVNAAGDITEIHVTAVSGRAPRLIARDVDSLLKVKADVEVDHRKIGVVIADPPSSGQLLIEEDPPPEPKAGELLIEEPPRPQERVLIQKISVSHEENEVRAEVSLSIKGQKSVGEAVDADTPSGHLSALVRATLESLLLLHDTETRFSDPQFRILTMGQEDIFVVYLSAVDSSGVQSFTGSALVQRDTRKTAVMATLSALNRVCGVWAPRSSLEFDIH
ncbi:MAG: hypothetical protein QGG80_01860 [Candidatus Krumholzibacteria bacterium]|jgi:hypothetical protein|nr:hypothetical protein [Candidatus Krumholzibacteria bacterium]